MITWSPRVERNDLVGMPSGWFVLARSVYMMRARGHGVSACGGHRVRWCIKHDWPWEGSDSLSTMLWPCSLLNVGCHHNEPTEKWLDVSLTLCLSGFLLVWILHLSCSAIHSTGNTHSFLIWILIFFLSWSLHSHPVFSIFSPVLSAVEEGSSKAMLLM